MRIDRSEVRALVLGLLVAGAMIAGLWWPTHARRRALTAQIEQADSVLRDSGAKDVGLSALAQKVELLKTSADAAQQRVPTQLGLGDLLRQLSLQADAQQVTSLEVSTKSIIAGPDYSIIPLTVQFHGLFPSVFGFLQAVEQMPRLVRVNRVDLHGVPSKPGDPLAVTIELYTFFVPGAEVRP